ncbi:MAG: protein kinase [Planctomycetes bacterium]|nr:protein kinase [Planctomycetota bacterium]
MTQLIPALLSPNAIRLPTREIEPSPTQLIDKYLSDTFILAEDWEALSTRDKDEILLGPDRNSVLAKLVKHGLLTDYQAGRIQAGTTFGLVLGSYRILERIGAGGMAVVFRAEHTDLRHTVAIKVLPSMPGQDLRLEHRFFAEMRTVAQLRHPNIVSAMDAGRLINPDPVGASYRYLVMEYVPGKDLEEFVQENGALPIGRACSLIYQIASALAETNKLRLVHRDMKPSNIMVTEEEQAKLLDFGLSRHFQNRMTVPGTVLGTIDYMAPEQARDASTVDIRADLYGLGGTLFFALTGKMPFPQSSSPVESLARRLNSQPPSLLPHVTDCPPELDRIVSKMMALAPEDRFQTPQEVMQVLLDFIRVDTPEHQPSFTPMMTPTSLTRTSSISAKSPRVLVVDDEEGVRAFASHILDMLGLECDLVETGEAALEAMETKTYDLVLLDLCMPNLSGREVMKKIRGEGKFPNLKIIILSGQATPDEMTKMLQEGADDFLSKPFSVIQFQGRVRSALRLKAAQDRSIVLNQELVETNAQLEKNLKSRDQDLTETRRALVLGLSQLVELRDARRGDHLTRMQKYCRAIAEAVARNPAFKDEINEEFVSTLECCVPLHDVGNVGLPDHILMKSGVLSAEERILMQTHTTFAADTLHGVALDYPGAGNFLRMAIDIIRHHHERFDGTGYPDKLMGKAIPLSARIVAICDVYDALRIRKPYKPSLPHRVTVQMITDAMPGQFDPDILAAFRKVAGDFEKIHTAHPE